MAGMDFEIKDIDKGIMARFRAEAKNRNLDLNKALSSAMKDWIDKKSILDYNPTDWGEGTEDSSSEIDETVYNRG